MVISCSGGSPNKIWSLKIWSLRRSKETTKKSKVRARPVIMLKEYFNVFDAGLVAYSSLLTPYICRSKVHTCNRGASPCSR